MIDDIYITENFLYDIKKTVKELFPNIIIEESEFLIKLLANIVKLILLKYYDRSKLYILKKNLRSNNRKELKILLLLLLPFLNEKQDTRGIYSFSQMSVEKNKGDINKEEASYKYTNIQYSLSKYKNGKVEERPLKKEDILHNYYLLCYSIDRVLNKLYVNWISVIPFEKVTENESNFYSNRFINGKLKKYNFVDKFLTDSDYKSDLISNDLTIEDIYNTCINNIYFNSNEISLLFNLNHEKNEYLQDFEFFFKELVSDGSNLTSLLNWSQLSNKQIIDFENKFKVLKNNFISNNLIKINKYLLINITLLFNKNYSKLNKIIKDDNYQKINEKYSYNDIISLNLNEFISTLKSIKAEDFYSYLILLIKKYGDLYESFLKNDLLLYFNLNLISKSLYEIDDNNNLNRYFYSNSEYNQDLIIKRLNNFNLLKDIFDKNNMLYLESQDNNFFIEYNENNKDIRRRIYKLIKNFMLNDGIYSVLDIDDEYIEFNSLPFGTKKTGLSKDIVSKNIRLHSNKNGAAYFLGNKDYNADCFKMKYKDENDEYVTNKYTEYLKNKNTSSWYSLFGLNWISQISFFHKYLNNRVIFVTGSTGVGKSSQIPKLLYYALKAIDRKISGKVICTQPRIPPTISNAKRISEELGFRYLIEMIVIILIYPLIILIFNINIVMRSI
jgi:hypothetical protein